VILIAVLVLHPLAPNLSLEQYSVYNHSVVTFHVCHFIDSCWVAVSQVCMTKLDQRIPLL